MRVLLLGMLMLSLLSPSWASPERPQMDDASAAQHRIEDYLGDWQPAPLTAAEVSSWQADFVVASDGSGTHRTVQAALDALPARPVNGRRHYIRISPGVYREQICVKAKAPFTLYGEASDAAAVLIVQGHYSAELRSPAGEGANPCVSASASAQVGTAGSASVAIFSHDVQLAFLSIANDAMDGVREGVGYPPAAGEGGGAQAVALMTEGDRLQFEHIRLLGHQDTFYVRLGALAQARVLLRQSLVAGDVDFIFGDATLVMDDSRVLSRAGRRTPGQGGIVFAPSTAPAQAYGFLVTGSRLLGEAGLAPGTVSLGRAWDAGVPKGDWVAGQSPNGQLLVRDSTLGPHIGPWAASTSRRPPSVSGEQAHRLSEYRNRAVGAAL